MPACSGAMTHVHWLLQYGDMISLGFFAQVSIADPQLPDVPLIAVSEALKHDVETMPADSRN